MSTEAMPAQGKEINKAWFYFVLSLAILSTQTAILMVPALLVEIATDLDVSVAVAGQLNTATFAAMAVSIVAVGPLADSFGRRPVAIAGVLLVLVSVFGSAFAPNMEVFLALRILGGLGGGTIPPTSVGVVSDVISPARRALAVSGIMGTVVLTSALTIPLVALFADWWGWRFAFMLAGFLLTASILLCWVWYPRDACERVRNLVFFARYWSLLSLNFFRVAVTLLLAQRLAYWGVVSFLAAHLIQAYDLSLEFVAIPLLITAIGQVVGTYAAGFVAAKSFRVALIVITTATGGVCGFLFFAANFRALAGGGTGYFGNRLVERNGPGDGDRHHGVLRGIQGHRRQRYWCQQLHGRSARSWARQRTSGDHRLRGDRLPVSQPHHRQRAVCRRIRHATARGQWLNRGRRNFPREAGPFRATPPRRPAQPRCSA